jgi:hypothetical protein
VWIVLSVLLIWHFDWQIHLVAMIFMLAILILNKIDIQEEATEQAYGLTLLCLVLSPHICVMVIGMLYIIGALLLRSHFTWRVLIATLLAIATYILYSSIFRYLGWLDFIWLENLPRISWQWWTMGGAVYLLLWGMIYLSIKKPSVASGVIYILIIFLAIACGVWNIVIA